MVHLESCHMYRGSRESQPSQGQIKGRSQAGIRSFNIKSVVQNFENVCLYEINIDLLTSPVSDIVLYFDVLNVMDREASAESG